MDISPARITAEDFIAYIEIEEGAPRTNMSWINRPARLILDRIL